MVRRESIARYMEKRLYQFRIIQGNNHAQIANAQTGHETTRVYKIRVLRACLHNDTDAEDYNGNYYCHPSTNGVGKIAVQKRANPSSKLENRGQHALADAGFCGISLGLTWILEKGVIE